MPIRSNEKAADLPVNMEGAVKQLEHAVELKPESEDLVKIEAKLKSGLPDETALAAETEHKKPGGG